MKQSELITCIGLVLTTGAVLYGTVALAPEKSENNGQPGNNPLPQPPQSQIMIEGYVVQSPEIDTETHPDDGIIKNGAGEETEG